MSCLSDGAKYKSIDSEIDAVSGEGEVYEGRKLLFRFHATRRSQGASEGAIVSLIVKETRAGGRNRASGGRVSETLGKAAQGSASLGRVRLPNIQAPSSVMCLRHGTKIHVKPCDENTRLYRSRTHDCAESGQ